MGYRTIVLDKEYHNGKTILGLDCSSKTVGWGLVHQVVDSKPILLAHGHFNPLSSKYSLLARLSNVFDKITEICEEFKPYCIAVEDIIQFMKRGGGSSAQTITILAAFNRVASLAGWRWSENVTYYPVATIRKTIREGIGRKNKIEKEEMPSIIRENLCSHFSDIISKNGKVSEMTMDEADGIAVAWCHALCLES